MNEKEISEIIETLEGAAMLCYEAEDVENFYKAIAILRNIKKIDIEIEDFIVKDTYTKGKIAGLNKAKLIISEINLNDNLTI